MERTENLVGELVNLAEFGEIRWWEGERPEEIRGFKLEPVKDESNIFYWIPVSSNTDFSHLGIEWKEPKYIYTVKVTYRDTPPDLNLVQIQYWQNNWPTPAPERLKGARRGWIGRDDAWHGQWKTANVDVEVIGNQHIYTFDPIDITEIPDVKRLEEAEDFNVNFRYTLKIRLLFKKDIKPAIVNLEVYSKSAWEKAEIDIHFSHEELEEDWSSKIEVWEGKLLKIEPINEGHKSIRLHILYAKSEAKSSENTIVTIKTRRRSFSFSVKDLLNNGSIYIKDYGIYITPTRGGISLEEYLKRISTKKSIYDKILSEPEQTYKRAKAEIPPLQKTKQHPPYGRYVVLGCKGNRQKFALRFNGDIFLNKQLLKLRGRDTSRLRWPGVEIHYKFATGDPPDFREREDGTCQSLKDGYLPVVTSQWVDREIEYKEETFVTLLKDSIKTLEEKHGNEDTICLVKFSIRNTTAGEKNAILWFLIQPDEKLSIEDNFILAEGRVVPGEPVKTHWKVQNYEKKYIRCYFKTSGDCQVKAYTYPSNPEATYSIANVILFNINLKSYEETTITLGIPFTSPCLEEEKRKDIISAVVEYEKKLLELVSYWEDYIKGGSIINVPNKDINDFWKAVPIHIAITANKDPYSGLYNLPAATLLYGACGNEACMQIKHLDFRGYHRDAEKYLETFIQTQGARPLDGLFTSKEGSLQGLEVYNGEVIEESFKYNLDHGFILTTLAEHYLITRDREWLRRIASNLIKACEFIIRERKTTENGLLPPGHLEDNPEWAQWFAVNAHAYKGLRLTAEILKEISHPQAEIIAKEADEYKKDILMAVEKAMIESPVVKILDDTYIPHIPTQTYIRGRELGWFREGAYGPLHLADCGILSPEDEKTTWILKDLEDNIFITREFGRPVDLEKYWFSHGGVSIQANLLNNGIIYLKRDQIEHAVRALYNNFVASFYPDVRVFTEHPVVELGHGVGPFYKTPDESNFLNWLRMFMVYEEGNKLFLAKGLPREWFEDGNIISIEKAPTFFGNLSYWIYSKVSCNIIEVTLDPPKRNPPAEIIIRLRHPEKKPIKSVTVNGVNYTNYDVEKEVIYLSGVYEKTNIVANY